MNKKLLLILSILMSLSLLSCAKSVAAPEGPVTPSNITYNDLRNYFKSLGVISDNGVSFDFANGNDSYPNNDPSAQDPYFFYVTPDSYDGKGSVNVNNVISQLNAALKSGNPAYGVKCSVNSYRLHSSGQGNLTVYITVSPLTIENNIPTHFNTVNLYFQYNSWEQTQQ
ncbi:hypothetical protein [Brachyspira pulli]|uniref:hypothetical protein n=1 Tax=Brachyspira pulli TaxID=310721 RepID=UPI003006E24E